MPIAVTLMVGLTSFATAKEFYETVFAGNGKTVWARMCDSTYCWFGACVNLESADPQTRATITLKASWRSSEIVTVGMGRYCAPQRSFTYFMTYGMFVEAPTQDIRVTIYESDDYRQ